MPNLTVGDVPQAVAERTKALSPVVLIDHNPQALKSSAHLADERWGVSSFFYRDTHGNVINVGMHTPNDNGDRA